MNMVKRMNNEKITLIIPIYNKEKYLHMCLESIANQTYQNMEIILMDDGSTDNSSEICSEFLMRDYRFKYYKQNNSGQTVARKKGLAYASSDYVTYVDADDWIEREYVQKLMNSISNTSTCDLVSSGIQIQSEHTCYSLYGGIREGDYEEDELVQIRGRIIFDDLHDSQGIVHSMSGKVFKKNILEIVFDQLDPDLTICEDGIAVFGYICLASGIRIINYSGYHYVQHYESSIHSVTDLDISKIELLRNEYVKLAKKFNIYEDVKYHIAKHISLVYAVIMGRSMNLESRKKMIIPNKVRESNSKIVIYGAGKRGRELQKQIKDYPNMICIAWVDKNYDQIDKRLNVKSVEELKHIKFDYILIAIENETIVRDVISELLKLAIPYEKIWKVQMIDWYIDR